MADPEVDTVLTGLLTSDDPSTVELSVALLGDRHCIRALPALLKVLDSSPNPPVEALCLTLQRIGDESVLPSMFERILQRKAAPEAVRVVTAVAKRSRPDAGARLISSALERARGDAMIDLIQLAGTLRADACLEQIRTALGGQEPEVRKAALSVLSEWHSAEPMGDLMKWAKQTKTETERVMALRGVIRMIGVASIKDPEKAEWCRKALDLSKTPDEQKRILGQLQNLRCAEAFQTALPLLKEPAVSAEAELALLRIARDGDANVKKSLPAGQLKDAMRHIAETSQNPKNAAAANQILLGL